MYNYDSNTNEVIMTTGEARMLYDTIHHMHLIKHLIEISKFYEIMEHDIEIDNNSHIEICNETFGKKKDSEEHRFPMNDSWRWGDEGGLFFDFRSLLFRIRFSEKYNKGEKLI